MLKFVIRTDDGQEFDPNELDFILRDVDADVESDDFYNAGDPTAEVCNAIQILRDYSREIEKVKVEEQE